MNGIELEHGFAFAVVSKAGQTPFDAIVTGSRAIALADVVHDVEYRKTGSAAGIFDDWDALSATVLDAHRSGFKGIDERHWIDLSDLQFHAPLLPRAQIYCSSANYRKQLVELIISRGGDPEIDVLPISERRPTAERMVEKRSRQGEPYFFLRPNSGLAAPYADIAVPDTEHQMDWEVELGVVIGRRSRNVKRDQALSHVAGYTILNDLTDRSKIYRKDFPGADWLRGKGMPASMPAGPVIVPACCVSDVGALRLRLWVDGELMQSELVSDMIIDIPRQIEYLSARCELLPGDVIATGTPAGTGAERGTFLRPGNVLKAQIDGLGFQLNRIV
ncbi:hypothetical protein WI73_21170 [Burkholderia ubonensis]|uniref:fumarylacetoacetate hydrolase family protein n=1 Tax=Burkholderia ubonensis TaxID=101571 RepID=UPI00075799BC|nr:fumarylacetoacetate hydrolase family protein [Burkholderia ubonensis]KVC65604.1 hypothetical protein WI73_21170 [Burkholderia ubonensis]